MDALIQHRIESFTKAQDRVGATYVEGQGVYIRLWAPDKDQVQVRWNMSDAFSLEKDQTGYFTGLIKQGKPGDTYQYVIDGKEYPDPASRYQPDGVYGPSQVVASEFAWTDAQWKGVPFDQWVIYEIHTGTFSTSHDFQGIIDDLGRLKDLGVTVLEIMPVSQFSGGRNWGYDGVFPHAVQSTYGGPQGLKALVDACHQHGMAIILDVVYNHLGPEGNVLPAMGPYFQKKYSTPWGDALNYDGAGSEDVRRYFLQTVWQWLTEYHFDGLRLDAIPTILDISPLTFLEELTRIKTQAEQERGFPLIVIAETDMNDPRFVTPSDQGGIGMDGQWADDLHHAIRAALTGETHSYYADYGAIDQLARIYDRGVAFEGEYSPFRQRRHGRSYEGVDKKRLVVPTQNHDQIGNSLEGKRLNAQLDFEQIKLMTAATFLTPFTPLFFMGEEFAVDQPFHYFVSHEDAELNAMVRKGRNEEFSLEGEEIDPASEEIFEMSVLKEKNPVPGTQPEIMSRFYKDVISWSKNLRKLSYKVSSDVEKRLITLEYADNPEHLVIFSFNSEAVKFQLPENGTWQTAFSSSDYMPGNKEFTHKTIPAYLDLKPFSATILRRESS